jgi:2Fe-2S ferredoxin
LIRPTHRVRVHPYDLELDVKDGQTIFRVANEAGLQWPTRCGGAKSCTLCTMVVLEGTENLSRPDEDESFLVNPIARRLEVEPARLRMACAARVRGPVVVEPRYALGSDLEGVE